MVPETKSVTPIPTLSPLEGNMTFINGVTWCVARPGATQEPNTLLDHPRLVRLQHLLAADRQLRHRLHAALVKRDRVSIDADSTIRERGPEENKQVTLGQHLREFAKLI
jgi:hypothetical protein